MNDTTLLSKPLSGRLADWVTAFSGEDPSVIASFYAQDARLWGTNSKAQDVGRREVERYFREVFERRPKRRVILGPHAFRHYDQAGIISGHYEFRSMTKDGRPYSLPARSSMTWLQVEVTG